jgi:D-sedoheptulose 7-phosphate isomerase
MKYFDELSQVLSRLDPSPALDLARDCQGTLWLAGNGGSASTAQHWACDLSKAAGRRAVALGANSAVLTAWANDVSYSEALANELHTLARPGDALICLSCSGRSPNIIAVCAMALRHALPLLLITGRSAPTYMDIPALTIPHDDYGILEDSMSAIGHWLTEELK